MKQTNGLVEKINQLIILREHNIWRHDEINTKNT